MIATESVETHQIKKQFDFASTRYTYPVSDAVIESIPTYPAFQRKEEDEEPLEDSAAIETKETAESGEPENISGLWMNYMFLFLIFAVIFLPIGLVRKSNYNKAIQRRNEIIASQRATCQLEQMMEVECGDGKRQFKYTVHSDKCEEGDPLFLWSLCSFEPEETFSALNGPFTCYHADCSSQIIQLKPPDVPEVSQEKWGRGCFRTGIVFVSLTVCCCLCACTFFTTEYYFKRE